MAYVVPLVRGAILPVTSFSIVTASPAPSTARYRDRMPVVLKESQFEDWMRGPPEMARNVPHSEVIGLIWKVGMTQSKETLLAQVDSLRDLARRARRLLQILSQEHNQQRLVEYAEELDNSADRLEKEAASAKTMTLKPLPQKDSG